MTEFERDLVTQLREECVAVRVRFAPWMGNRKALTPEQRSKMATLFEASEKYVSGSSKLLGKHKALTKISGLKRRAHETWEAMTLPYVEHTVRLLRRRDMDRFSDLFNRFDSELYQAIDEANEALPDMLEAAKKTVVGRGQLFNRNDYPQSFDGAFRISWEPVNLDPPPFLKDFQPRVWEQWQERINARFADAIELAEGAFMEEFGNLVAKIATTLGSEDKIIRPEPLKNLLDFFERFKSISVRSNQDLDKLVEQAKEVVSGVSYEQLKRGRGLQVVVAESMNRIGAQVEQLMQLRPSRAIVLDDE